MPAADTLLRQTRHHASRCSFHLLPKLLLLAAWLAGCSSCC
jgi:hypothetical protein